VTLAQRPVPVLVAALVACAAVVLGATAIAPVLGAALEGWSAAGQEAVFALILYGVLALVAVGGRALAGGSPGAGAPTWLLTGAGVGVGGLLLALVDARLAGAVVRGAGEGGATALLFGTVVVLGQSAAEELFFRGWLQPVLARSWAPAVAIGVTALAFAGLHVAGGARAPLTLVNLALGGVLFGLLAWRSGGLLAPVAAHFGWNWAEGILFGLDPNPGTGSFGAVCDLDLAGAALWGGSAEGLNASLAMTCVLAALVLPLAARPLTPKPVRGIA
jgi:uncharacterized protein